MVATDTVIGVAGAVLLAAVMVGVFVYEYNNAPPVEGGNGTDDPVKIAAFGTAYPALNATQDLDGDGVANYNDADMDQDGVADVDQTTDLVVRGRWSASSATPPAMTADGKAITAATGVTGLHATMNYTAAAAAPVPRLTNLDLTLSPEGGSSQSTQTGTTVTVTLDAPALAPGSYTLTVSQAQPGPSVPYDVSYTLNYGPAKPAATPAA